MSNLTGVKFVKVANPTRRIPNADESFAWRSRYHYYRSTFYENNDCLMLKLRLIGLTLLAFSAATAVHAEEKRYVSDELNTWVRSGPGDNYRLVGTINAGEEVVLLQSNADSSYGQVRDSSGRTAWIPLKELSTSPSLRTRVPDL